MQIGLTAIYRKVAEGYIGYVEELPGANSQGKTLDEVKQNLREAIQLVLEANKMLSEDNTSQNYDYKESFELNLA
jgi:predicted RNase H-like HicB family nuclease